MKDRAGNELKANDHVLYLSAGKNTTTLEHAVIHSFTEKKVRILPTNHPMGRAILRDPRSVIKPFKEPCIYDCSYCHEGEEDE